MNTTLTTTENLTFPDSKVHGTNMRPIWGRQDLGGRHVGPINFAIWVIALTTSTNAYVCAWYFRWISFEC